MRWPDCNILQWCSRPSSPPILLSRPHNLHSTSQSRCVKGEYFASPTPTQRSQQHFPCIRMEISVTPSCTHAHTQPTQRCCAVLFTDPLRYLHLHALIMY